MTVKNLGALRALADDTRLRLYNILSHQELNVNEIVRIMQMGQSRVSRHLKILTEAGLLTSRRDGLRVYYSANEAQEIEPLGSAVRTFIEREPSVKADLLRTQEVVRERSRRTRQFFDSIAGSWEDLKKEIYGEFDLNAEIMRHVNACGTAVDVGCGTGDLIDLLQNKADRVIGIDSSPGMLEQARHRFEGQTRAELRLGEVEHLPLSDGEADLTVMNMVLHHLSQPEGAIREVGRTLKPGDPFLIAELEKHGLDSMRDAFGDRWLGFDRRDMQRWLKSAGFTFTDDLAFELNHRLKLIIYRSRKT